MAVSRPGDAALEAFVTALDGRVDIEVVETESAHELKLAVRRACDDGFDTVASIGGDGTLNLVVAAIGSSGAGSRPSVCPVPAGTVNMVSQVLGLVDAEAAAESVVAGGTRPVDVGAASASTEAGITGDAGNPSRPFVLNASSGYDAAVIADADDQSDARFGRLRFLVAGARRIRKESRRHVRVVVDGEVAFDGRAMSVVAMNVAQRASMSLRMAPDAAIDDGVLDIAIMRADSIGRMISTIVRLLRGAEPADADLVRASGEVIDVVWNEPVETQRDGDLDEPAGRLTYTVAMRSLDAHCS